jgi:hypothetical protein
VLAGDGRRATGDALDPVDRVDGTRRDQTENGQRATILRVCDVRAIAQVG